MSSFLNGKRGEGGRAGQETQGARVTGHVPMFPAFFQPNFPRLL